MKHRIFAASLLAGTSALALTSLAQAQTAPAAPAASSEEVVVTGSRVIQNGNNSPIPVTVTTTAAILQAQPNTVYQALNNLPQLNNSQGVTANAGGGTQAQAQNTPNLRNLNISGVPRTLVLWDGNRVAPTNNQFMTVDEAMIPQMLLQRVDVVTGGVSAVYGSDAVAGVVNFITDTKFNGIKFNAQYGVAQRDGLDQSKDIGIAGGKSFMNGRLHVEGSFEYFDDPGVLTGRSDYPWEQQLWTLQGKGSSGPFYLYNNSRTNNYTFGGLIQGAASATNPYGGAAGSSSGGWQFGPGGTLIPFNHGTPTANANIEQGGDGAYSQGTSLKSSLESDQLFGRADFDVTNNIHAWAQLAGTTNHYIYDQGLNTFNYNFSTSNAFLTPAEQVALSGGTGTTMGSIGSFKMQEEPLNFPPTQSQAFETQYMAFGGVDGTFGDGYKWDVRGSHGYALQHSRVTNNANYTDLVASLDAVRNPANGQIVCASALSNPSQYGNCVPLDLFGVNSASQAAIDYVFHSTDYWSTTKMDDLSGSLTGSPLKTWAGPVNMALSGEWRNTSLSLVSNSLPSDRPACSTLAASTQALNCGASLTSATSGQVLWLQGNQADRPPTSQAVEEGAFEVDAPILKDMFLARDVSLNGAVRETNYSTSGSVTTWKVGVDWHVNDELTLRATRSQDIRAPNLTELYAPISVGLTTALDSVTGLNSVQVPRETVANPNLKPEIAQNTTAGFVYRPSAIPGMSLTLDAFDIELNNAIAQVAGDNGPTQIACINSGGASPYCALDVRPFPISNTTPANQATAFLIESINVGQIRTYGADLEVNYATRWLDRPLSVRLLGTYQPHLTNVTPGLTATDQGGVQPTPAVRLTGFVTYSPIDNFTVTWTERWRSSEGWNTTSSLNGAVIEPRIPSIAYTTLNLAYVLKRGWGQTELFLNVQNLFDTPPVVAATTGGVGNPGGGNNSGYTVGDDLIGRYFTMGVHFRY